MFRRFANTTCPCCRLPQFATTSYKTSVFGNVAGRSLQDTSASSILVGSAAPGSAHQTSFQTPAIWLVLVVLPCCGPRKEYRRRSRMLISALSHCAFFRASAYAMRWPARCRGWESMIPWSWWCVVRRTVPSLKSTVHTRRVAHPSPRSSACGPFVLTGKQTYRKFPTAAVWGISTRL